MTRSQRFVATAFATVFAGVLAGWMVLGPEARTAVAWAGAAVLAVQSALHFGLRGWRGRNDRFYRAIAVAALSRAATVGAAVLLLVVAPELLAPLPFLLALGVFMVVVSFLEPVIESGLPLRGRAARGTGPTGATGPARGTGRAGATRATRATGSARGTGHAGATRNAPGASRA